MTEIAATTVGLVHRRGQRGSALLIVFLFAAILAISLFIEMPIVVFEAKRAKEQLLVDRGTEYAHAVKLYYRKFRAYPSSIDQLENTNNMRFLRHRFKDPMTGQDNWRLLHAGPGGILTDSKVNPIGLNANAQTSTTNGANTFGNNSTGSTNNAAGVGNASTSGFGSASSSSAFSNASTSPSGDTASGTAIPALPQRPPEMPVNGGGTAPAVNVDPAQSLLTPSATEPYQPPQLGAVAPVAGAGNEANTSSPGQAQAQNTLNAANPMQGVQGLFSNPNPASGANGAGSAPITNTNSPGSGISSPTSSFGSNTAGTQGRAGVLQSGGIAGVASIAKGKSIKAINDQSDYSLWEFYYDPTKDTAGVGQSGINPLSGTVAPTNPTNPSTPFGSNNTIPANTQPAANPAPPVTPPGQP